MSVAADARTAAAGIFAQHADSTFLVDTIGGRKLTYGEVDELADGLAGELVRRGVRPGDRVGLVLPNSAELATLYFACLRLGATAVPLAIGTPETEIARALRETRATLALRSTEGLFEAARRTRFEGADADADVLLSVSFTSGTTSTPKGVAHRARSLLGAAAAFGRELEFAPDDRLLHTFPMTYMAGFLNTLFCPFVAGAAVVLAPAFDNRTLLHFWKPVVEHEVTRLWLTPTIVSALLRVDRDETGPAHVRERIRSVSSATAPLPRRHALAFAERYGAPIHDSYGLSELTFVATGSPRRPAAEGAVGRVLPDIDVAAAEDGELLVRTPFAMAGYVGADGAPDPVTSPAWFPTGDVGHVDEEGQLFITGRKKDVIIRGGMNVSPRAIEDVLARHPAVAEASVVGVPHDVLGEEVAAALILVPGRSLDEERESLLALCRELLPTAAVPGRFVGIADLPRNEAGKVRKDDLRALLVER